MFVSFVIATYNCSERVSVLQETVRRFAEFPCEFCVSDGGSTDGTPARLANVPGLRVLRSSPDRGIYDAWNLVLDQCRGEYVSFIGVDDEPARPFVEAAQRHRAAHGSRAFIYGDALLRRDGLFRSIRAPDKPVLFESERPSFDVPHPGALNHRSLFVGARFNPAYRLAGDLEFYLRSRQAIRAHGYLKLPETQATVDARGVSWSARAYQMYRAEYEQIERELGMRMGYSDTRLRALSLFERVPQVFEGLRWLSWQMRGRRHA